MDRLHNKVDFLLPCRGLLIELTRLTIIIAVGNVKTITV